MKVFNAFVAASLILGAATLSAQEPGKQPPAGREPAKSAAGEASKADQEIAAVKLVEARNEIELAKLAQQKSQNEQVRQFAARLVKEHGDGLKDLEKAAGDYAKTERAPGGGGVAVETNREGGVNVDVRRGAGSGSSLNWVAIHQQIAERCLAHAKQELTQKEGAEFDKCFIGMQIMAHQKMIDADTVFANYVSAEAKEKIDECKKVATDHLRAAKEIMEKLEPKTAARSTARE